VDKVVLVIDRDDAERRRIAVILWEASFRVIAAARTIQGMVQVMEAEPTLIVMAEETKPLRLQEVVRVVHRLTGAPVMVIGSGGTEEEVELLMGGADFYLGRPFTPAELVSRARMLIRRGEARWEEPEADLSTQEPLAGPPKTAGSPVRRMGMSVLRQDEEGLTRENNAAA
jgi:DNA-binding response OmpR family regulator